MMTAQDRRRWQWRLAALSATAIAAVPVILVWRSPRSDHLATYGQFALAVVTLAGTVVIWTWRRGRPGHSADVFDTERLERIADQLAAVVDVQWRSAAEERGLAGTIPIRVAWRRAASAIAGPVAAATESRRFDPLPGFAGVETTDLAAGSVTELHSLYAGLRSGRLIIVGPPGSGKTGAAVLLVLDALRYRREVPAGDRSRVPVPVLFTVQDWDPGSRPVADWLASKLRETYGLFADASGLETAAALVSSGRVSVILDGLDEISAELLPVALRALSEQGIFRLVVLSRTNEITAAASRGGLLGAAAVELDPVDVTDAANYLELAQRAPSSAGWVELVQRIRAESASPLARALDNPLALTLVRDTFEDEDSIHDFLKFCDSLIGAPAGSAAEAIADRLLDRVLPAAYARHPGQAPPPYELAIAEHALIRIAAQMNELGTRDLNWWQISVWISAAPRTVAPLVAGVLTGAATARITGLWGGIPLGTGEVITLWVLSAVAVVWALAVGLVVIGADMMGEELHIRVNSAAEMQDLSRYKVPSILALLAAASFGLLGGTRDGIAVGAAEGAMSGFVIGYISWATARLLAAEDGWPDELSSGAPDTASLNPVISWRRGWITAAWSVGGQVAWGSAVGLVLTLVFGFRFGLPAGLMLGLGSGWFMLPMTAAYSVSAASLQLAITRGTPPRLAQFLEDAHQRGVLRVAGPAYQFRHARLQDRLAAAAARDPSVQVRPARPGFPDETGDSHQGTSWGKGSK